MNGRVVAGRNGNAKELNNWNDKIDVSSLSPGMYFAEVYVGNQRFNGKFMKAGK
jgi:hypothetical protein